MNELSKERLEKIKEMATDAAKGYGAKWLSEWVWGKDGNYNAITSDQIDDVVVRANDDKRESAWLCDYLEEVSPATVISLIDELLQRRAAADKSIEESITDAISEFSEMNIGFPTERFKSDFVIRWVFVNYANILSKRSQKMRVKYTGDYVNELSKERLEKIVSWRETYGASHNVVIPAAEAEEMATELLQRRAAAENPVFQVVYDGGWHDVEEHIYRQGVDDQRETRIVYLSSPLTSAEMIQSVSVDPRDELEKEFPIPKPTPVVVPTFEQWLESMESKPLGWLRDAMKESYDACQNAMLKSSGGEPVSNPDTLPSTQITEGDITRIMQNSWNEYCDDTGCCPDDFRVDSGTGYLEFETGAWANLVAKRIISKLRQRSGNTGELSNG